MDKKQAKNIRNTFGRNESLTRNVILPERTILAMRPSINSYKRYTYLQKKLDDITPLKKDNTQPLIQKIETVSSTEADNKIAFENAPEMLNIDNIHTQKESILGNTFPNEINKKQKGKKTLSFNILTKLSNRKIGVIYRYALIAVIIGATGYLFIDTWKTNKNLKQDLVTTVSALGAPNAEVRQNNEGKDETPVGQEDIKKHAVAPSLPKIITIDKINISARILSMDVNPDNSVQAPINVNDAGWYTGSSKPGEPGAALMDGHVSGPTGKGLFSNLNKLVKGDEVMIERGDGKKFIYEVVHTEIVKREEVDMQKILKTYDWVPQGLNLITCAGIFDKGSSTYDQRFIVYTNLIRQE